jgi:DNA topoisomerase II
MKSLSTQPIIKYVLSLIKSFASLEFQMCFSTKVRDPSMTMIKVEVSKDSSHISVWNNGKGIPIEIHTKEKIYIPQMIFGNLLTSSNYKDDEKKVTGGRNGFGAKLANIYSKEFILETADGKKKYKQVWENNMEKMKDPKISDNPRDEEYTKVSFKPDWNRFGSVYFHSFSVYKYQNLTGNNS